MLAIFFPFWLASLLESLRWADLLFLMRDITDTFMPFEIHEHGYAEGFLQDGVDSLKRASSVLL